MVPCPNCGRENADNFNFCLGCGFDLKTYRAETAAAAPESNAPTLHDEPTRKLPNAQPSAVSSALSEAYAPTASAQPAVQLPVPTPQAAPLAQAAPAPQPQVAPSAAPSGIAPALQPASTGGIAMATTPPTPAASETRCPSCLAAVAPGMKFCAECGFKLGSAPHAHAPAGQTTPPPAVASRVCRLVTIDQSGQEGMTYQLTEGETVAGRVNGMVLFYDDPFVSPTHATLRFFGDTLSVRDENSLNGIYRRVHGERQLVSGDTLRIGRQLFRYEPSMPPSALSRADGDDARVWGSPDPEPFGCLLQVLEDGQSGEVRLLAGQECLLGREQGQIVFPLDGFISARHCAFYPASGGVYVKDLGSSNGTYVRIRGEESFQNGDVMLIGNQMLRIEMMG